MAGGSLSHFLADLHLDPRLRGLLKAGPEQCDHQRVAAKGLCLVLCQSFLLGKKSSRMSVGRKLLVPIPRPFSTSPVDLRLISPPVARPPSQTDSGVLPLLTYKMWDMSTCVERRGRGCDGREQTLRLLMMGGMGGWGGSRARESGRAGGLWGRLMDDVFQMLRSHLRSKGKGLPTGGSDHRSHTTSFIKHGKLQISLSLTKFNK